MAQSVNSYATTYLHGARTTYQLNDAWVTKGKEVQETRRFNSGLLTDVS